VEIESPQETVENRPRSFHFW